MQIINTSVFRKLLLVSVLLLTVHVGHAQDPDDPSPTDPAVPVDGGITLLLGAGVVYGVRRYRVLRREGKGDNQAVK
jgi:hypothetical protein